MILMSCYFHNLIKCAPSRPASLRPNPMLFQYITFGLDHKTIFTVRENACIPKMPEYRIQWHFCIRNVYKLINSTRTKIGMSYTP